MESKLHLIGAGVSLAIGISILACGGGLGNAGGGTPCTFDDECSPTQVCSQDLNVCEETCVDDSECAIGEACLPRGGNAQGFTCQFDDSNNTGGNNDMGVTPTGCTSNEECPLLDGVEGICFMGECDYPEETFRWIKIQDESAGDDACDNTDPGSDIMGVRLLDASGQLVGWGEAGNENLGEAGSRDNKYDTTVRLDGQPNGLDVLECPEDGGLSGLMPPPFSTGCGGWVLIQFVNGGTPADIKDGYRIEVLEYGPNCGGSNADRYSVYLCTDTASAQGGSDSSCGEAIGGQQGGFGNVTVSL